MAENKELDSLAFDIFARRIAAQPINRNAEHEALEAYRKAEAFITVRDSVRSGALVPAKLSGPQLCDCSAPNLKRTHPHNLVSQAFGDLAKVNRIKAWLDKNPTPESDPSELVVKCNREFPELGWDLPAVNTARAVFPAYCVSK